MPNENRKLLKQIILDEIGGKNQAIHGYDKLIWTVRTGFLTLIFAGWGLLLSGIGKEGNFDRKVLFLIPTMYIVSIALGIGGYIIDLNYVKRKFRVIHALNELMELLTETSEDDLDKKFRIKKFQELLKVSGDTKSETYKEESGYEEAKEVSLYLYSIPLIGIGFAAILLYVFIKVL